MGLIWVRTGVSCHPYPELHRQLHRQTEHRARGQRGRGWLGSALFSVNVEVQATVNSPLNHHSSLQCSLHRASSKIQIRSSRFPT